MKPHLHSKWVIGALLVALSPPAWVQSADDSPFAGSLAGLHRLSDTLDAFRDKVVFNYASDQVGAASGKMPELFGSTGEARGAGAGVGGHFFDIVLGRGTETFTRQLDTESGVKAEAEMEELYGWLARGGIPKTVGDILPQSLVELSNKVRAFPGDVSWRADQVDAAQASGGAVRTAQNRVRSYLTEDSQYGLEPNGGDGQVVLAAIQREGGLVVPDLTSYDVEWADSNVRTVPEEVSDATTLPANGSWSDMAEERVVSTSTQAPEQRKGAFADDLAALEGEEGPTPSVTGSFADDLAALGENRGTVSVESGSLADDVAALEDDLGVVATTGNGVADWNHDVSEATVATEAWERQQEAERQAAALRERKRQEALALQQRQEEARQQELARQEQEEFARQQQANLERMRHEQAVAAAEASEYERQRAALAEANQQNDSDAGSGGSIWGAIGAVAIGAAAGYYAGKHGIDIPSSVPYATTTSRSNTGGSGGSGSGACDRALAIMEEYNREISRTSSQCEIGKLSKTYGQRIAASGCQDYASWGKEVAENGELRMRGFCSGYN